MKNVINIVLIGVLFASCGGEKVGTHNKDKKAILAEKQAELKKLEDEIKTLQAEVNAENPAGPMVAAQVNASLVTQRDFKRYVDLQGAVMTDNVINIGSDIGGRIVKIYVKEGQKVSKGQLIASVDAESIEKQKEELQKSLDLAVDVYERQKRLWDQNIGSEVQYLQAKNNKERLEKSIATIQSQLRKKNAYSPISGVVDKLILKEGEIASPGMPITTVINVAKVKVVADVPEIYLGKVKLGDKVSISFPALSKEIVKPISLIGSTIDPNNRTFKLEAFVDNPTGELKPNLLAIMKINDLHLKNVIYLPVDIIQQDVTGKSYVFLADKTKENPTAKKQLITKGESAQNSIVITSGVDKDNLIITKGGLTIEDGQPIIINKIDTLK